MNKLPPLLLLLTCFLLVLSLPNGNLTTHAYASTMTNDSMQLQIEEATPTPEAISQEKQTLPANIFEGNGYTVDESDSDPLTFSSSSDVIDFGPLSPTNPLLRTSSFSINDRSQKGFQIVAFENHPLISSASAVIPDTTCDNGLCKESNSSSWTNTLTYGFGYHCAGDVCAEGFGQANLYKQFADQSHAELSISVLDGFRVANASAQITYQLNISGTQPTNFPYQNVVTFIAVPNL